MTIYQQSSSSNKPLFDAFKARFPDITLTTVDLIGPALIARLDAESMSGGPQAELVMNSQPDQLGLSNGGHLIPYTPPTATNLPEAFIGRDGEWRAYLMTIGGIYYNTNRVKAADAPTSYADLVDPKWKGRLATGSLRTASGTSQAFTAMLRDKVITPEWIQALADSKIFISPSVSAAIQVVTSGQADVGLDIPYYYFLASKAQGAPIEFVFPKEGVTSISLAISKLKGAKNALAGDLYFSWMFSPQAQSILAEMGVQSTMPGSPPSSSIPKGREVAFHPIDWKTLVEIYPKQLATFQAIFPN
ncbi:iron(III) transport system substrate-binding protein [Neorhizobium galegae]|uniref:ABC transporter substrate-binding protein n=1 Tax=Neorhizobium galegae TaxID=399 RepID=UPI002787D6C9|nr:extracellular solute-binding protein [Neorhizobium galegae]MDQ0137702.1 iron(III) transport system substrate-binding protein [Neorhizobium galegae]